MPLFAQYRCLASMTCLAAALGLSLANPAVAKKSDNERGGGRSTEKVWICHVPPGNPLQARSIHVDAHSLDGHGNHEYDLLDGPCPEEGAGGPDDAPAEGDDREDGGRDDSETRDGDDTPGAEQDTRGQNDDGFDEGEGDDAPDNEEDRNNGVDANDDEATPSRTGSTTPPTTPTGTPGSHGSTSLHEFTLCTGSGQGRKIRVGITGRATVTAFTCG